MNASRFSLFKSWALTQWADVDAYLTRGGQ
jgi:hypothetical protein